MRIQKITTQQPQFNAVNQKYMAWAKKDYSLEKNVSMEWLDKLSFDVFLFKKISRQDAIDTINAVKKFMKKPMWELKIRLNHSEILINSIICQCPN